MTDLKFAGFSPAALGFLDDLKVNNTRDWFAANKTTYETEIKRPAASFCETMSGQLTKLTGRDHKAKVYRIHRDVRFSKDKTPYNAHLHISFEPESNLQSPPMWFFGLGTEKLSLGCGVFGFDKAELDLFRSRVTAPTGGEIAETLGGLEKAGARMSEPQLKRVPHGYPKDHPRSDLLRHKGLASWLDHENRSWVTKPEMMSLCLKEFKKLYPIFDLLIDER